MNNLAYKTLKKNSPRAKILFLGYCNKQTRLIDELIKRKCEVWHSTEKYQCSWELDFDLVISFGYKHLIKKETFNNLKTPIINLHISYLPWNRGAHPNFWSFYDSTPSGVTIHRIDQGIDTGEVIYQRIVKFRDEENTFSKTYKKLITEIESLFMENIEQIISKTFISFPQKGEGSYHSLSELPKEFLGWNSLINVEVSRLKTLLSE